MISGQLSPGSLAISISTQFKEIINILSSMPALIVKLTLLLAIKFVI